MADCVAYFLVGAAGMRLSGADHVPRQDHRIWPGRDSWWRLKRSELAYTAESGLDHYKRCKVLQMSSEIADADVRRPDTWAGPVVSAHHRWLAPQAGAAGIMVVPAAACCILPQASGRERRSHALWPWNCRRPPARPNPRPED
jgi:hypothetical protein